MLVGLGGGLGVPPDWTESPESLKKAEETLWQCVSAGEEAKNALAPKWSRFRDFYHNRPAGLEGSSWRHKAHVPLVQPKIDALVSHIVNTLCGSEPYCRAEAPSGTDPALVRRKEEIVHKFLSAAGLRERLEEACVIAGWSNAAHVFVCEASGGLRLEAHAPDEVGVYPAWVKRAEDALCVWRNFTMTLGQAKAKYGEEAARLALASSSPRQDAERLYGAKFHEDPGPVARSEDAPVLLAECFFSDEAGDKWAATVSRTAPVSLRRQKIGGPDSPMRLVRARIKPESSIGYWSESSVADDLQSVQLAVNDVFCGMLDGIEWSVMGAGMSEAYGGPEQYVRLQPGSVAFGEGMGSVHYNYPVPRLEHCLPTIAWLNSLADVIARVSVTAQGGQTASRKTATEVSAIVAGQQAAFVSYLATFSPTMEKVFDAASKIILENLPMMAASRTGTVLGLTMEDEKALSVPCVWKTVAQSPANTPESQQRMLAGLMSMAAQVPQTGIDPYSLASRVLAEAERQGLMDATDVQRPKDPMEVAKWVSVALDLPLEAVAAALEQASALTANADGPVSNDGQGLVETGGMGVEEALADLGIVGEGPAEGRGLGALRF